MALGGDWTYEALVDAAALYQKPDTPTPGLKRIEFAIKSPGSGFALTLSTALVR